MHNQSEKAQYQTGIHWCSCLPEMLWLLLMFFPMVKSLIHLSSSFFILLILGTLPLLLKAIKNNFCHYVLTDQYLCVETGIFVKRRSMVLYDKINDFDMRQGFIQKQFDVGNMTILTGNDTSIILENIAYFEKFNQELRLRIEQRKK